MEKKSSKDRKKQEKLSSRDYSHEQKQHQKEYLEDVQHSNARSQLLSSLTTKSGEKLPTHVVIDCSMFSYIDTAGITQLKSTIKDYESIGVKTYLAGIATHVDQLLEMDNFYKEVPPHHVYITIQDAVHHAQQDQLGYDFDNEEMEEQQSRHEEEQDDETTSCLH